MNSDWFEYSEERRIDFLQGELTGAFSFEPMSNDMAPRNYYRVTNNSKTYVLMESAPDGHAQALPGHEIKAFLQMAAFLKTEKVRVPDVIAISEHLGFILLEDLGDITLEKALQGASFEETEAFYMQATDLLLKFKQIGTNRLFEIPTFTGSRIDEGVRRFADWFLPYFYNRQVSDDEITSFQDMLLKIKSDLPAIESGFVHGDFHPANLMILEKGEFAVLDFQAAMRGPSVYDLANLLHDARRNVDKNIIWNCQDLYFQDEEIALSPWYKYLYLHFHLRVIGQFIKVAITTGKVEYLNHVDRLWRYLQQNHTAAFQEYSKEAGLDFSSDLPELNLNKIKKNIRSDAT